MDPQQDARFREALRRKSEDTQGAGPARGTTPPPGTDHSELADHERQLIADDRPQGTPDPRATNTRHGQVTADKWNQ